MNEQSAFEQISEQRSTPLYRQLYQLLRRKILSGAWRPGDRLPSETALVEQFDVSRATVRQAFDELVSDGLIYRKRGRGTFVAPPSVEQSLVRIVSFTEDMRQRGLVPGTRLLSATLVSAPAVIADRLGVEPGIELARIERLRLADNEPMSVEASYLVHRYCRGVLDTDYTKNSLRQILEERYGIRIARAQQTIQAIQPPRPVARALDIDYKAPVLFLERISYSEYDVPIEFLRIYHRGDRYTLHADLRG
jgi:GntR family transcriptional regulator